jgi:PhoPQ-activated pathogenicity-related protein
MCCKLIALVYLCIHAAIQSMSLNQAVLCRYVIRVVDVNCASKQGWPFCCGCLRTADRVQELPRINLLAFSIYKQN